MTASANMIISVDLLNAFLTDLFINLKVPKDDSSICADVLVTANKLSIDSEGVMICKSNYYDKIKAGKIKIITQFDTIKETNTTAVIDAHNGIGEVVAHQSMIMAINKAKKNGLSMVVIRNSTNPGFIGYYSKMASDNDMIGISGTNTPTYALNKENDIYPNLFSIAIPTDEEFPFLLDTNFIQTNHNNSYKNDFWVITEILSSALQTGTFLTTLSNNEFQNSRKDNSGHFFMVIDPEAFLGIKSFKRITGNIFRYLKENPQNAEKNYNTIWKSLSSWSKNSKNGIQLNTQVCSDLILMRNELKLSQYVFPWEN